MRGGGRGGTSPEPPVKTEACVGKAASKWLQLQGAKCCRETPSLGRGVLIKSSSTFWVLWKFAFLPKVPWGALTILRDRKPFTQEEGGLLGNFSSPVLMETPGAKRQHSWAQGRRQHLGQGEMRWEVRARGPTRNFWLLPRLTELGPAGAASFLPGQGCSSGRPSLARAAQPRPAAPTPPRD